jgi:hypothetical protein
LYTQLISSVSVSDKQYDDEIETNIPIEILEVRRVLQVVRADQNGGILNQGRDSHNVKE